MSAAEGLRDFREVVVGAVHRCAGGRVFVHDALAREFERRRFPTRLRGPAAELASGIVRRRITLDHLIAQFSNVPLHKVHPLLLDILRLAACEILFGGRAAVHASVSEAVELAKRLVRPEFSGFANAVLRALVRAVEGTTRREGEWSPSARELPVGRGVVVCFARDVFPDPQADLTGWLAAAGGMPRWLVERWQHRFNPAQVLQVIEASNASAPVAVRVNVLKTTVRALAGELEGAGVATTPGEVEGSLRLQAPAELTTLDAFRAGRFYIQDEAAMLAPHVLAPRAGEKVLDLCAAPGGKTTHLAELAGDAAEIYALDSSSERLRLVEENARRLGITSIRTAVGDARRVPDAMRGAFDAALADVPCSNTGVLRRRVEARHRLRPETIGQMTQVQADILRTALASVKPAGRVVYSTCSIEPEENGGVVRRALADHAGWTLDFEETHLPVPEGPDGAYVARLVRL